jgi:hypothetical protein
MKGHYTGQNLYMGSLYTTTVGRQDSRRAQRHIFLAYWGAFVLLGKALN